MSDESKTNYEKELVSLSNAIKQGDTERSIDLIKKIPAEHLFFPDAEGRTHLQNAIGLGRNDVASALIRKEGVTVGQLLSRDKNGKTALDDAIRLGQSERIVEILTSESINCKIKPQTLEIIPTKDLTTFIPIETINAAGNVLVLEMEKFKKTYTQIDNKILETDNKNLEVAELELMFKKKSPKREGEALDRETLKLNTQFLKPDALIKKSKQWRKSRSPELLTYEPSRQR